MKKNRSNIFYSWLILTCFIAGQYAVFAHQHKISVRAVHAAYSPAKNQARQIIQEKCPLCDAMHHTIMIIEHPVYFNPNIVTNYFYCVYNYDFVGISLVISAGRAPPVSICC